MEQVRQMDKRAWGSLSSVVWAVELLDAGVRVGAARTPLDPAKTRLAKATQAKGHVKAKCDGCEICKVNLGPSKRQKGY
jgi:hypothetical protein